MTASPRLLKPEPNSINAPSNGFIVKNVSIIWSASVATLFNISLVNGSQQTSKLRLLANSSPQPDTQTVAMLGVGAYAR